MAKCLICGNKMNDIIGSKVIRIQRKTFEVCATCGMYLDNFEKAVDEKSSMVKFYYDYFSSRKNENWETELGEKITDLLDASVEKIEMQDREAEKKLREKEEWEKRSSEILESFLITTGFNFEGYKIKKYLKVVSGDIVLGTGFLSEFDADFSDLLGMKSNTYSDKIRSARQFANEQMVRNAFSYGANAIIGVNYNICSFSRNMIGVSATGTAVIIKSIED